MYASWWDEVEVMDDSHVCVKQVRLSKREGHTLYVYTVLFTFDEIFIARESHQMCRVNGDGAEMYHPEPY